jgi:transposase
VLRHDVKICVIRVLTDEEWALVAPMIPPARRGGRPRDVNMREVINGLLYLLWTGCQWQALPKDLPPKSTVHYYFKLWDWEGRPHYAGDPTQDDPFDRKIILFPARPRKQTAGAELMSP